jgi:circadian clock protein KaiC
LLGLQFLIAGAKKGESGLYVGFFERPTNLRSKANRIGLGLDGVEKAHGRKLLHLCWEAPIEGVLDDVVERVLHDVKTHDVKRVCFDGLHGFRHHAEFPERTRAVFSALADALIRFGVTSIFTLETTDLIGPRIAIPLDGVSALADNLLLLRHVEFRAELCRLISIVKIRDQGYDARIREFKIDDHGLSVVDTFDRAEQILTGTAHVVPETAQE